MNDITITCHSCSTPTLISNCYLSLSDSRVLCSGCVSARKPETVFHDHLASASYHFADDSTSEWDEARKHLQAAARVAVENNWSDEKIAEQHIAAQALPTLDHLMEYVTRMR